MNKITLDNLQSLETSNKLIAPSAEKNKEIILQQLQIIMQQNQVIVNILEIGSGTGQHCQYFAKNMKNTFWIASEPDEKSRNSIKEYSQDIHNIDQNILDLDLNRSDWHQSFTSSFHSLQINYIYSSNVIHIAPYSIVQSIFQGASHILSKEAKIIFYGPFQIDGQFTSESNKQFDIKLKQLNPDYGVRDSLQLDIIATQFGFQFFQKIDMPNNNFILIWKKIN